MIGMKSRRLGKFYISFDTVDKSEDYLYQIMGRVIVVRAEALLHSHMVEYVAVSKHFDEVEEGFMVPEYKAIIHSEDGFQRFEKVC